MARMKHLHAVSLDQGAYCTLVCDVQVIADKFCNLYSKRAARQGKTFSETAYECKTQADGPQKGMCIDTSWVLDGREDCPLGDDEGNTSGLLNNCVVTKF